jgi:hypothetical protein
LKNKDLDKAIEMHISNVEKNIVKYSKINVIINFYQKKVNKYFIKQELVNLWESWKFYFILKKENTELQLIEANNTKQKENKIRDFLYYVLEKINDKFDFMPDFNIEEKDELPAETFPYEVIYQM